jgi:hypothetical protein
MSLDKEQLIDHCKTIITSCRIKNKITVLCEGDISNIKGTSSPQLYRKMENMPDSNFYKACVPNWWKQYLPQFFNCGDRNDVINTYFMLPDVHKESEEESYLSPSKLFAMVDLDLQTKKIENYDFTDTESIFKNLYNGIKVNEKNALNHRIWVTGLIHKEAYFLLPELQDTVFDAYKTAPLYNDNPLILKDIYMEMCDSIYNEVDNDLDIHNNFKRVCGRIKYCAGLDFSNQKNLKDSFKKKFEKTDDILQKEELVFALLMIKKAKEFWHKTTPSDEWTGGSHHRFREQLSLEIGRYYSKKSNNTKYHIPYFLSILYKIENLR